MLDAFAFVTMATDCDSMGVICISVSSIGGGMGTTGVCFHTYLSATPIIELTDEIMLAAVPICEETAPITATILKTAAVYFTTFAMLVIPLKI